MTTISTTILHGVTIATSGTYASPLTITTTGYIGNTGTGDAIFGPGTQAWAIYNYGRVAAAAADGGAGVDLQDGGSVHNGVSITGTAALIKGGSGTTGALVLGGPGITIANSGSVMNNATVAGGQGGAGGLEIIGAGYGGGNGGAGIGVSGAGTIVNSLLIVGGQGGAGHNGSSIPGGTGPEAPAPLAATASACPERAMSRIPARSQAPAVARAVLESLVMPGAPEAPAASGSLSPGAPSGTRPGASRAASAPRAAIPPLPWPNPASAGPESACRGRAASRMRVWYRAATAARAATRP